MGKDVLRTWHSFGGAGAKKPPLKGEVPAKRAEGFRSPTPHFFNCSSKTAAGS